jgi:hypothetical protein
MSTTSLALEVAVSSTAEEASPYRSTSSSPTAEMLLLVNLRAVLIILSVGDGNIAKYHVSQVVFEMTYLRLCATFRNGSR